MKLGILFSGGKDSTFAMYLAKQNGYEIVCLITIKSENKDSFMFHTPSIEKTKIQAEIMNIPLIIVETEGEKETELKDLEKAILIAKKKYKIEGVVSGAIESIYQASRIQKICHKLGLECFNPLWQKDQEELLQELVKNKFGVVITGISAEGLDKKWLGRKIDKNFIEDIKKLKEKYNINPAGEGGEFESFVLFAPGLFKRRLKLKSWKDFGQEGSWRRELTVE